MKSTGEVMGVARDFGEAFYKAALGAGDRLPADGKIFVSFNELSRVELLDDIRQLVDAGFTLVATEGTAQFFISRGIPCEQVFKVSEGRPNILDLVKNREIQLIYNTPRGKIPKFDSNSIRHGCPALSYSDNNDRSAIKASVEGILRMKRDRSMTIRAIQDYHAEVK
jgi:carbamoyl-phosphate synthase large subunit